MDNITSKNIDALRWYFLITVVLTHIYKLYYQIFDNIIVNWIGFLSVCGFIFISGYVNYFSIKKYSLKRKFLKSRFKRIVPAYIITMFFSLFVLYMFSIEIKLDWLYNFLFLQSLFGFETIISNESLWSLPYEIALYVFLLVSYKNRALLIASIGIVIFYSYFSKSYLPFLFMVIFNLGCFFAYNNIKLDIIKIKFFEIKNYTYEIYLIHYPILLIYFFKIIPMFKS